MSKNIGIIVQDEAGRVLYEVEFPPYMPVFNPMVFTVGSSFEVVEARLRRQEAAPLIHPQPAEEAPCELEKRVEHRLLDVKRRKN